MGRKPAAAKPTKGGVIPDRRITFRIPEALHKRIRVHAALRGISMMDAAREALERANWERAS
jgi:hypothetical protein